MNQNQTIKNKKRQFEGVVVSDKMSKTRVIEISRLKKNSRYEKYISVSSRFKAHDENNEYQNGDVVLIEETRPISKDKRWKIIKLLKKFDKKENSEPIVEEEIKD